MFSAELVFMRSAAPKNVVVWATTDTGNNGNSSGSVSTGRRTASLRPRIHATWNSYKHTLLSDYESSGPFVCVPVSNQYISMRQKRKRKVLSADILTDSLYRNII